MHDFTAPNQWKARQQMNVPTDWEGSNQQTDLEANV